MGCIAPHRDLHRQRGTHRGHVPQAAPAPSHGIGNPHGLPAVKDGEGCEPKSEKQIQKETHSVSKNQTKYRTQPGPIWPNDIYISIAYFSFKTLPYVLTCTHMLFNVVWEHDYMSKLISWHVFENVLIHLVSICSSVLFSLPKLGSGRRRTFCEIATVFCALIKEQGITKRSCTQICRKNKIVDDHNIKKKRQCSFQTMDPTLLCIR